MCSVDVQAYALGLSHEIQLEVQGPVDSKFEMTSRYQVNYQLRSHKRDQFIEFIKTLLLTPFVLVSAKPQSSESKV
jgi:hypothetical protein